MGYVTRCSAKNTNLRVWFAVASAILAVACTKKPVVADTDSAPLVEAAMVGDTAQSFYPEKNGEATKALIAPGNWDSAAGHEWIGPVDCGDGSTCGGQTTVRIRIRPRVNAHTVNHRRVLNGQDPERFLAELTNLDPVPFGPWHIGANDNAYLYIGLQATGNRRLAIYDIDPITGSSTLLVTAQAETVCEVSTQHTFPRAEIYMPWHCKGMADLRVLYGMPYPPNLKTGATQATPFVSFASNSSSSAVAQALTSGLWISCTGGCCEGSAFQ